MTTPPKTLSDDGQAPCYCRWADPQSPYVIELETGLADRLLAGIPDGQSELAEFGGLLIGEYAKAAKPTLRINDIVWISHQASENPRFELTPEERIQLSATRRKLITPTRTVLGFFRTHTRNSPLVLSATDLELLEREFRRAFHVALLIRANHAPTAAFFVQDERSRMQASPAHGEFRFDSRELLRRAQPRQAVSSTLAPSPRPQWPGSVSPRQTRPDAEGAWTTAPASIWRDLRTYRPILLPLAVSCIALCLLFTLWAPVTASVLFSGPPLQLSATGNAEMVDVHWRIRFPDSEHVNSATLIVEDGGLRREIHLSPAELKSGAAAYAPLAGRVRFTLVLSFPNSMTVAQSTDWVGKLPAGPHASTVSNKA